MNINILRLRINVYGPVHGNALSRLILMLAITFTCVIQTKHS